MLHKYDSDESIVVRLINFIFIGPCNTVSGPDSNQPCRFPFTYQGIAHHKCTTRNDTKYWCATQNSSSWHSDEFYGYCNSSCPLEELRGK